ncbi:hypothetical protein ACVW0Y_003683 [Pseudomonas sp. TE3786]
MRQQSAVIEAAGDLDMDAGNNLVVSASQLKAGNEAYFYAGEQLALLSAEDSDHALYDKKSTGSLGAKQTRKDETTSVRNVGTTIVTGGDLSLVSKGDQHYQKASLQSGAALTLDSGGAINFEAVKDLEQESHQRSKSDWAWNSAKGQGSSDERLRQSELIANGETIIRAVNGVHIDIQQIDRQSVSQTIDAMVAADPNLAWLKAAQQRGDVDWRRVKEIHDSWDYQSSGLGGGAALIIAIVVTVLTTGAASAALGAAFSTGAGSTMAAATAGAAAGAGNIAATAAITSAASTAAVSAINNKGNLGKTLKDVTSADNLKNYVVAGVTAGIIAGVIDPALKVNTDPSNGTIQGFDLSTLSGVGGMTQHAAATALVQAGVGTAIKGGSLSDNLQSALTSQLQGVLQAVAFNAVGDYSQGKWADGSPQKIALHALVGGLLSKAAGNEFATGAAAAGANELLIKQLDGLVASNPELLVAASQIVGIAAAGLTDGDAQMGADIAKSATSYNYLNHKEVEELAQALVGCRDNADPAQCRADTVKRFEDISNQKTNLALNVCRQAQESGCSKQLDDIRNGSDALDGFIKNSDLSQTERDILQDFSDSNFHDWQLGQNLWFKEFLKESGAVGGLLVGGGVAAVNKQISGVLDDVKAGTGGGWNALDEVVHPSVVKQSTSTACGAACGEMLLKDRGILVSQVELGTELTSMTTLANKLNRFDPGWVGSPLDVSSFNALNKTGSWSAMMWSPAGRVGHWVVVNGLDDVGRVVIKDPYAGTQYKMSVEKFKEVWNGYSVYKE